MRINARVVAPILLPPNPVWRSYAGGRVLRRFRGLEGVEDNHFPEDWLASTVRARNGANAQGPDEGLSVAGDAGGKIFLAQLLREEPEFWFGPDEAERTSMNVLWKLLDSSGRLQFQAHPDARYAAAHLNSNAGKTECWYILASRGDACIYLGFQRPPKRPEWGRMIAEQRIEDMLACFDKIPVKPGDCYVVPAGTPHAIGAGVFMVELMEPTDWVVRCERNNAGVTLPPEACYMGLDLETCLDVFDYRSYSVAEVGRVFKQQARTLRRGKSFAEDEIIGSAWHSFFRLNRWHGTGNADWPGNELMLLIALRGDAQLEGEGAMQAVRAGQTWLLPGAASGWRWRAATSDWEFLIAKLPKPDKPGTERGGG